MTSAPASMSNRAVCADAAPAVLHVEVADTMEACQGLREPWLELRQRTGILVPNSDPDRFLAIVGVRAAARPYVVLFRKFDEPRAMIVARVERRPISHPVGYVRVRSPCLRCLDVVYGGLLCENARVILECVSQHLRGLLNSGEIDCLFCNHMRAADPLMPLLLEGKIIAARDLHFVRRLVPGSIEQTLAGHSAAHRSKIRRYDRILCEAFGGDVALRVFSRPDEVSELLRQVSSIASQTYQHELGVAVEDTELWRAILAVEANAGRMRSYVLTGGGRPIAYQNGVLYGRTFFCDGRGYDPHYRELRPGNALSHRIAADLCACACERIDYGFGDADYKRVYATDHWEEVTVHAYGRSPRARLAAALSTLTRGASAVLAGTASYAGIFRRIKNVWRRRMPHDGG